MDFVCKLISKSVLLVVYPIVYVFSFVCHFFKLVFK